MTLDEFVNYKPKTILKKIVYYPVVYIGWLFAIMPMIFLLLAIGVKDAAEKHPVAYGIGFYLFYWALKNNGFDSDACFDQ